MDSQFKKCCFTGHRPEKYPWLSDKDSQAYMVFENKLTKVIREKIDQGYNYFIAGNALGVDTIAAEIILKLKKDNPELFLEIAVPFKGHNSEATKVVQEKADWSHVVCEEDVSYASAYHIRNRYMVDNSDAIIACLDTSVKKGGSYKTWQYAKSEELDVTVLDIGDLKNCKKATECMTKNP